MYLAWYLPLTGRICPVVVVDVEGERAVVWKVLNGIILERVVEFSDLFTLPFWTQEFSTKGM